MFTKILIIDDDAGICSRLKTYLEREGYGTATVDNGHEALSAFKKYDPDLVLLDLMLPGLGGKEICAEIRKFSSTPIMIISAKNEIVDKVVCLELGADDYLVKPFDLNELGARIKAVLRRCRKRDERSEGEVLIFDKMEISKQKYELRLNGKAVDIPPKELELLYFLASNYNHVFNRDQLLDKVWGFDYLGDSRTVDVHVKRLREKLEGVSDKWALKTVWGVGYKFEVNA